MALAIPTELELLLEALVRWPFSWLFKEPVHDPFGVEMIEVSGAAVVRYLKGIGWRGTK